MIMTDKKVTTVTKIINLIIMSYHSKNYHATAIKVLQQMINVIAKTEL